ncbi:hypothetical protein KDW72_gp55 [Mycobacterium phage Grizzly]|uniref:Uncharacterized protein n=1 Tax=Mycobacterium phage Grizzly TaxID=2315539 RepID=A0A386KEJ9_9CAUD|nr:hypothetical protein KDW72_gp55 [Mycobacterium phage Grizzly]AYD84018.1 hypothetical protein SEA_GRIZZLY_55 [Mycobacterium phage Grizzly]QPL15275.1 hypothetical protein SEA_PEEB_55 [Mycobacterium phage Peeb]UXQ88518.1 hypothetical protein [Mycobacterium phage Kashi_BG2]
MSRIWAALPLLEDPLDPNAPVIPPDACWWRHPLARNEDGHELIVRTDSTSDMRAARLGCWEWFDGLDAQLIFGVDVFRVHHTFDGARSHLDVLALDVPTRSLAWRNLTEPGDWHVPRVDEYVIPSDAFVRLPYAVAPHPVRP